MYFLIYVSSATSEFSSGDLLTLLDSCRKNNTNAGISGMLLYKDGNFMQVLEGDQQTVQALYNKIGRDTRHRGVIKLLDGILPERQFAEWSMGFQDLGTEEVQTLPGFTEFMNTRLSAEEFFANPTLCQRLLGSFKQGMR